MASPTPQQIQQIQAQLATEAQRRGMTPQQLQAQQQQHIAAEAEKQGISVEQYIANMKANIMRQHQAQQQALAQGQQGGHNHGNQPHVHGPQKMKQQVSIKPGSPPAPEALALAKFLRSQDLKTRTCIHNGERRDMFKVKRALRAMQSPEYAKAQEKKGSNLPVVKDLESAQQAFTLLPISWLAIQVSKVDPHEGHNHGPSKTKRVKGLWTVRLDQHMTTEPMTHYMWLYQGPQWKQKLYAVGALVVIMTVVFFPLWPLTLRIWVWYLSMGLLGLLGLFFLMSIFRLILFVITMFAASPGLWLFPNLFEDVGFFDSFKPLWGWQETGKKKKSKPGKPEKSKKSKKSGGATKSPSSNSSAIPDPTPTPAPVKSATSSNGTADATSTAVHNPTSTPTPRKEYSATVEEADDD